MENTQVKEVAIKLANVAIVNFNDKDLSGEQREHNVCEFFAGLVKTLPGAAWIPQELIADVLDVGVDNVQAYYVASGAKAFIQKCFHRLAHILHLVK